MNFSFMSDISAIASFLEGILSFFSPCVLPLLPVYFSFLSGGNAERDEKGDLVYKRGKVILNTLFFVLGISLTFFILSLGVKGIGKVFSLYNDVFSIIGGVIIVAFGLWQLLFYGTKYCVKKEKRININTSRAKGPVLSFLLGFSFSFSWTPCIGPILSSVLILSSSSVKGELYLILYALGFTLPFILLGFFTSSLLSFFQKYKRVVKYSVRIGAVIMIALGVIMIISSFDIKGNEEVENMDIEGEYVPASLIEDAEENIKEEREESGIDSSFSFEKYNPTTTPDAEVDNSSSMEESDTKDYIQRNYIEETKEESLLSEESSIKEDEVINVEEETKNDKVSESLKKESSEEAKIEEGNEKCDLDSLNFSFLDQYGKIHRLSSYKGKVIFLNCWATWCSPCRSELGEIEELYKKYKDSDDVVILTSTFPNQSGEGNASSIKEFMNKNGYTFPVLFDNSGKILSTLGIYAFPTTFLFDKKGNVYGYIPGAMNIETMERVISEALNSL